MPVDSESTGQRISRSYASAGGDDSQPAVALWLYNMFVVNNTPVSKTQRLVQVVHGLMFVTSLSLKLLKLRRG